SVKRRRAVARGAQDVGRQPAVPGAGLDEVERLVASEHGGHLIQLTFTELTEQRTGVDAGKKIAPATGSPVGAGVVTELGMVKRQLHERGHRHRTAFTD